MSSSVLDGWYIVSTRLERLTHLARRYLFKISAELASIHIMYSYISAQINKSPVFTNFTNRGTGDASRYRTELIQG